MMDTEVIIMLKKVTNKIFGSPHYFPILLSVGRTGAWLQAFGALFFLFCSFFGGPLGSLEMAGEFLESSLLTAMICLALRVTFGKLKCEKDSVS